MTTDLNTLAVLAPPVLFSLGLAFTVAIDPYIWTFFYAVARAFLNQSDWEKFVWIEEHGSLAGFPG